MQDAVKTYKMVVMPLYDHHLVHFDFLRSNLKYILLLYKKYYLTNLFIFLVKCWAIIPLVATQPSQWNIRNKLWEL